MIEHRDRIAPHLIALLAAALIACGTVTGSAGRAVGSTSDTPSGERLTEFEYAGQGAAPKAAPSTGSTGPSESGAGSDGPFLIP